MIEATTAQASSGNTIYQSSSFYVRNINFLSLVRALVQSQFSSIRDMLVFSRFLFFRIYASSCYSIFKFYNLTRNNYQYSIGIKQRFYHKIQNNLSNFRLIDKFSIEFLKKMKMDGYLNEFCKSLKHLIKKGKYKENIQKVQKFIEREMNNFNFFSDETKIELLHKQTYCCHQLILKQLIEPKDHFNRYLLIQLIKISSRNVSMSYQILLKHLKNKQVIINFENEINEYKNQADTISPQISQKPLSQFLQSVIWLVKDFSLVYFLKKDHAKIDGLLSIAISFICTVEDSLKKKKIRFKLSQLQVKSLYIVHLFRIKQYQLGSVACQKNSTQIFEFISLLSHKYKSIPQSSKYLKKSYKLLLMTFLYQAFFHTALGIFHPIEALISIITKISEIPGPKTFIRRYQNYPKIVELLKSLIKNHEQFHHHFGNGQIFSIIAIKSIKENSQILGHDKLNKESNIKSKKSSGNKKIGFQEKEQKQNFQININNLPGRQQNKIKRQSGVNKSLYQCKFKLNQEKQGPKNNVLNFFVKNYSQMETNHAGLKKIEEGKIFQKNQEKKQSISFNQLCHMGFDNKNKKLPLANLINRQIVSLYQDVISDNFKDKKVELSRKKLHGRNTYQISLEKKEQLNFENDKNKLWGQFKQNVREAEKNIIRQTKNIGVPSEYSFLTQNFKQIDKKIIQPKKTNKFIRFEERKNIMSTVRISLHKEIQERKRAVFSMAEQGQYGLDKGKSVSIFENFIKLLIKNKVHLSIVSFASKYEVHLKKVENQKIKEMEEIKNGQQNSFKKMTSQKQIGKSKTLFEWKPKCKINKLNINKMRSQHIILDPNTSKNSKIWKKISSEEQYARKSRKSNLNCEIYFEKQMEQASLYPILNCTETKSQRIENLYHKRHYVSKYEHIGEDQKLVAQLSKQQYEKKLKLCFEKSKQSIDDIRKKLIRKQERKQSSSFSKTQLAYFHV